MQPLRSYQRVADKEHWCDVCCGYIHPGEMYSGTVFVDRSRKKYRLVVFKKHVCPSCEPPPDPSDEKRKNHSGNIESRMAA